MANKGNKEKQISKKRAILNVEHTKSNLNIEATSLCALAETLCHQGRHKEAIENLKKAVEYTPNDSNIYNRLGSSYFSLQLYEEAAYYFNQSIKANPNNDNIYNSLSVSLHELGKEDDAIKWLNAGLKINPTNASLIYNLANALKGKGEVDSAARLLKIAIRLNPEDADAFNNLGIINKDSGKLNDAINYFKKAVEINPRHAEANFNLGNTYHSKGDFEKAVNSFNKAIEAKNIFPEAYNNLGMSLAETSNHGLAKQSYEQALAQKPRYPKALNNLGNTLESQGQVFAAAMMYKKAINIDRNYSEAIKNLGMTELSIGDYKNGWKNYEHRFNCSSAHEFVKYIPQCPKWNGSDILDSEPLWILCEQGLGDTIQFMRYIKVLKARGYRTIICCAERLHSLIQACDVDSSPLTLEQVKNKTFGQWIPLLSIPRYLGVDPKNPIVKHPYIQTTVEHRRKWHNLLKANTKPIVGIHWQGNPTIETGSLSGRSLQLEKFKRLSQCREISLLSLQKGAGSEQVNDCSFKRKFISCQNQVNATWDFLETAAIIENCDLCTK